MAAARCSILPSYDGYVLPKFPSLMPDTDKHIEAIQAFDSKESDVIISNYPKTGTNWMYEIVSMLFCGRAEYNSNLKIVGMLESNDMTTLEDMASPRILNTHVPFRHLPRKHIENGYKIIHVLRNPKDVMVSWYNHCVLDTIFLGHKTEEYEFPGSWENYLRDQEENYHNFYDGFFNYEREWENAKRTKQVSNVHTVFYEDLKKNTVSEIERLATYLGVDIDGEILKEVADKCSFENLLEAAPKVKEGISQLPAGLGVFFRKGTIGDWKNWFTVAQNERFDAFVEKELKDSTLKFTYD